MLTNIYPSRYDTGDAPKKSAHPRLHGYTRELTEVSSGSTEEASASPKAHTRPAIQKHCVLGTPHTTCRQFHEESSGMVTAYVAFAKAEP